MKFGHEVTYDTFYHLRLKYVKNKELDHFSDFLLSAKQPYCLSGAIGTTGAAANNSRGPNERFRSSTLCEGQNMRVTA